MLVKRGFQTNEIMVVLVTGTSVFPSKNDFVKELLRLHPEITTIVQNINNKFTSMVLGDKETVLFGKGYIEDEKENHQPCLFQFIDRHGMSEPFIERMEQYAPYP